jgi:CRP-like cAMP-binding protein
MGTNGVPGRRPGRPAVHVEEHILGTIGIAPVGDARAADALADSDLLAGLDPIGRRSALAVLRRAPEERWPAGRTAPVRAGTSGLVLVTRGRLEQVALADGREVVLAHARAGELITCFPRGTGAPREDMLGHALEDSALAPLDHALLTELGAIPGALLNVISGCVARAERLQLAAAGLAHRRVESRVLYALHALAADDGTVTAAGVRVAWIRQHDLARVANVTRAGAGRALARLEGRGLIAREDGAVVLLRPRPAPGAESVLRRQRRAAAPRVLARERPAALSAAMIDGRR